MERNFSKIKREPFLPFQGNLILTILFGLAIGFWLFISKSTFIVVGGASIIFIILRYAAPEQDERFFSIVIIIAFLVRICAAILYHYGYLLHGYADALGPDGEVYSLNGWYISRLMLGRDLYTMPNSTVFKYIDYENLVNIIHSEGWPAYSSYQAGKYSYYIGLIFASIGYSPLVIKIINCLYSILTGITIYHIGSEVFNQRVGKISMVVFLFMPSSVLFSITALKEPLIVLSLTAIVWLLIKFQKDNKLIIGALFLLPISAIYFLRENLIIPIIAFIASSIVLGSRLGIKKKNAIILTAIIIFIALYFAGADRLKQEIDPGKLFASHVGYVSTGGNVYKIIPEKFYVYSGEVFGIPSDIYGLISDMSFREVVFSVIKGIFHFLYEPLISRPHSKAAVLAYFQTFLILVFTPFILVGMLTGVRHERPRIVPIVFYVMMFLPLIAISEGNIGTAFRHRDMLMPFLIISGVAGLCGVLGQLDLKK